MAGTKYGHYVFIDFDPVEMGRDERKIRYSVVLDAKGSEKFAGKPFSVAACVTKEPG